MYDSTICSIEDTNQIALKVSKKIREGTILLLNGDLGSGKTQFVRFLGNHLESVDTISSPTFLILNIYECKEKLKIYHFDFYRVKDVQELEDIGFFEILNDEEGLIVVEWAERYQEVFTKFKNRTIDIYFNFIKANIDCREILVKGNL